MDDLKPIIEEYPLDYCRMLEDVYGIGLMSEGGTKAIDDLFIDISLEGKKVLDLGSGLGGFAFYLSEKYNCSVLGLEINENMNKEAIKRTPAELKNKVDFLTYSKISEIPVESNSFDIISSKGVLVHVNEKLTLFKELHRILKEDGTLIINDWLCSNIGTWSEDIQKMCELEKLTLYPFTVESYSEIFNKSDFKIKKIENKSEKYAEYNMELVNYLKKNKEEFIKKYNEKTWKENIQGYELISKSQLNNELLLIEFTATKN